MLFRRSRRVRPSAFLWVRATPSTGLVLEGQLPLAKADSGGDSAVTISSHHSLRLGDGSPWSSRWCLGSVRRHWAGVTRRSPVPLLECPCHVLGSWLHRLLPVILPAVRPQRQPIWLMSSDRSGAKGGQSCPLHGLLWVEVRPPNPQAGTLLLAPDLERELLQR